MSITTHSLARLDVNARPPVTGILEAIGHTPLVADGSRTRIRTVSRTFRSGKVAVHRAGTERRHPSAWRDKGHRFPNTKTHTPRSVWSPDTLAHYVRTSRELNKPSASSPVLWDCSGRGFGRVEDPASPITPRVINSALTRGCGTANLPIRITAHIAKHSYCTNWVQEHGSGELAIEKLSRQVGTSVTVLRKTYVHFNLDTADWAHIKSLGEPKGVVRVA
jgi:hypothetical protein